MACRPRQVSIEAFAFERIGDELLVSDCERSRFHALNEPARRLWEACDGTRSVAELATVVYGNATPESVAVVRDAVRALAESELIEGCAARSFDRRTAIRLIGGSALALPMIASISFPTPASALTCTPGVTGWIGDYVGCAASGSASCLSCCCCASGPDTGGFCHPDPAACNGSSTHKCW